MRDTSSQRLGVLAYCHAMLVLAVPIGLAFVLLLAFEFKIADSLPALVRIAVVVLVWIGVSLATNHAFEAPDRNRAKEARARAETVRANTPARVPADLLAISQKPIPPRGQDFRF